MRDFIFFAAVYGLSVSLTVLGIGAPMRWALTKLDFALFRNETGSYLKTLAHCPACLGFWIALGATFWHAPLGRFWADRLAVALAAVGINWIAHVTLSKLGQYEL